MARHTRHQRAFPAQELASARTRNESPICARAIPHPGVVDGQTASLAGPDSGDRPERRPTNPRKGCNRPAVSPAVTVSTAPAAIPAQSGAFELFEAPDYLDRTDVMDFEDFRHPSNALTQEEIADHRTLRLFFQRHRDGGVHLGFRVNWQGRDYWRISIRFFAVDLNLLFITFPRYERNLRLLGPYRNA